MEYIPNQIEECEISLCHCDQQLPDWTIIDPRLIAGPCTGWRWHISVDRNTIWEACDSLGDVIGKSKYVDQLLVPLTGYTKWEFIAELMQST